MKETNNKEQFLEFSLDDTSLMIQETAVFRPVHPIEKKPLGVTFTFHSPNSESYLNAVRKQQAEIMNKSIARKRNMKDQEVTITPADIYEGEQDSKKLLAEAFVTCEGLKGFEPSKENFLKLISRPEYAWLYHQIDTWHKNESNYFLDLKKN
jgi:hypothetical protein